jgi:hypothetical protein
MATKQPTILNVLKSVSGAEQINIVCTVPEETGPLSRKR